MKPARQRIHWIPLAFLFAPLVVSAPCVAAETDGGPEISYVSDGIRHWEAGYIFGEGFDGKGLDVLAWDPKDDRPAAQIVAEAIEHCAAPPAEPPQEARRLTDRIKVVSPQALACVYRDGWIKVLWAKTERGLSKPYVANRPRVFFIEYTTACPGQVVRIVGRNLLAHYWKPSTSAWLVPDGGGKAVEADVGYAEGDSQQHMNYEMDYIVRVRIPDGIAPGKYRVWVCVGQGGPLGVAGPLELTVAEPKSPDVKELNVSDFGAAPSDRKDDTDAILRAIAAAATCTPSRVRFDLGEYLVCRPIVVPPGVSLAGRGAAHTTVRAHPEEAFRREFAFVGAMAERAKDWEHYFRAHHDTPMFHLAADSSLADMAIRSKQGIDWNVLVGNPKDANRRVTVTGCALEQLHATWMSPKTGWQPSGGCIGFLGATEECEVSRCTLEGIGGISVVGGPTSRCRTVRNRYRPTTGRYGTSGMGWLIGRHCIVEYNTCEESNRGFTCGPWHGPVEQNLIYRNQVVNGGSMHGAGESVLFEGPGVGPENWFGRPSRTGDDFFEIAGKPLEPDALAGRIALVVHGRGLGGFRRVKGNTDSRITLVEPWAVQPDAQSWVLVRQFFYENILLNQYGRDTLGGIEFYGGGLSNVVERFVGLRTGMGVEIFASDTEDQQKRVAFGATFHTLVRGCRFDDGMGAFLWANRLTDRLMPATLLLGHRIVDCEFNRSTSVFRNEILRTTPPNGWLAPDDPLIANAPAACAHTVFSGCRFQPLPGVKPIRLAPGNAGTVLWWSSLDGRLHATPSQCIDGNAEGVVTFSE
jgi:hypothetical protein